MNVTDMKYVRPDLDAFETEFKSLLQSFSEATSPEAAIDLVNQMNALRSQVNSMFQLSNIRNSIDSQDEFYKEEKSFSDKNHPRCTQQLWKRSRTDMKSTWADYLKLCQLGGSKSFLELVKETNLISPFADGCMEFIVGDING